MLQYIISCKPLKSYFVWPQVCVGSNLGTLHQGLRQAHSPKQELCARCLHHAICAILCAKRSAPLFAPSDLRHRFTYVRKGQERGVLTAVTGRGTATGNHMASGRGASISGVEHECIIALHRRSVFSLATRVGLPYFRCRIYLWASFNYRHLSQVNF